MQSMHFLRKVTFVFVLVFLLPFITYAADLNFPYGNFSMKLPPSEDPFPGMGNYYTALSRGMKSVLWNPASLGKLKLAETSISIISALEKYTYNKSYTLTESISSMGSDSGGSMGNWGMFFRYPNDITGMTTKDVEAIGKADYATSSTGVNFSSALKVNDHIAIGFTSNNPFEISMDIAGDLPVTAKALTNFYGQSLGEMQIGTDGKLRYTYHAGPVVATYESTNSVWGGFLSQEAVIPLTNLAEIRNDFNFHSPFTGTLASKFGNFYAGINMIPINATANIENNIRSVVNAGTNDVELRTPNFDPTDQADISDWSTNEARYANEAGYSTKRLNLPAGEIIATSNYRGYYSASTARFDLGAMYDVNEWFTIGLALENIGGSSLNFKGNGIATYINYREINTAETGTFDDLIQPGADTEIDLISDRWTTTFEVGGTPLYLEPEKTYALPRKIRYGFALKRPFLIVLDFESNQTPIKYYTTENNQTKEIIISNINLIRFGGETQLFALPCWLRGGFTFLSKPTISGLSTDEQANLDNLFQYGVLPIAINLGTDINAWGTIVGGAFGGNPGSLINFVQLDTTNIDLSKMVYYTIYAKRDAWQIDYLAQLDPFSTAAAYGSKTVPAGQEKTFEVSDVKFVQTLGVTYRF